MSAAYIGLAVLLLIGSAVAVWTSWRFPKEDLGHVSPGWVRRRNGGYR